jgi:UDP-glucuronate decarboxylase
MIRWIIENKIGTAPADFQFAGNDFSLLDVRDLVDKSGNAPSLIKEKIDQGVQLLGLGKPLIICCDYGISRSNAIAAGIIALYYKKTLSESVKEVIRATGEKEIKIDVIDKVRQALETENEKSNKILLPKILITGASGFIGQNLSKLLNDKYTYVSLTSKEINLFDGAIELDTLVKENEITHIVHLASPKVSLSNKSMGNTLTILRNILEVCSKNFIKLIYPSCWVIYSGYKSSNLLADEGLPPNPSGAYGETKWLCEMLIKFFETHHQLQCVLLRTCSLYGVSSDRPKFLWSFINSALNSLPLKIHNYLNGVPYIDLMNVSDFCHALINVIDNNYVGEINLGSGCLLSIKDIAEIICHKLNSKSKIITVDVDDYFASILMDTKKANEILQWQVSIPFENGIDELIEKCKHY